MCNDVRITLNPFLKSQITKKINPIKFLEHKKSVPNDFLKPR